MTTPSVPTPSVTLRRARPEDGDTLVAFNRAMALETEGLALDDARLDRGVRALLADERKGHYLVAVRGDELVGQLMITYEWSDWRDGTYWWIQSVYVARSARRTGVYRALHDRVLADARAQRGDRVVGVRLYVDRDNRVAQSTYAALGMSHARYDLYELHLT